MPRKAHPWFRKSDGWWYIKLSGKPEKLARGRENKQAAIDRWHELATQQAANPPVESDEHTVASVIDLHLTHAKRLYAEQSYANRRYYLQLFAEAHGYRLLRDCRPMNGPIYFRR